MRISDWSSDVCSSDLFLRIVYFPCWLETREIHTTKFQVNTPILKLRTHPIAHSEACVFHIIEPTLLGKVVLQGSRLLFLCARRLRRFAKPLKANRQIGRASCRGRVGPYV